MISTKKAAMADQNPGMEAVSPAELQSVDGGFFFLVAIAVVALAGCATCGSNSTAKGGTLPKQP